MILKMMMMLAVFLNLILNFDNLMMIILIHKKDGDFLTWKTFAMICEEDLRASFLVVSTAPCCYVNNYWRRLLSLTTSWNALAKLQMRISPCPSSFRDYTRIKVHYHHHLDFLVWPQKYQGGQRLFCQCCCPCCCCSCCYYWPLCCPLIIVGPL